MEILHLSDLHITDELESFGSIETTLKGALAGRRFDFVVVSGDLSQRAQPSEYEDLLRFAREFLVTNLLHRPEVARVIFVPGNHDVDWTKPVADLVSVNELLAKQGRAKLEQNLQVPVKSPLRRFLGPHDHFDYYQLRGSDEHAKRFENVNNFLREFYGGVLDTPSNHQFQLLDEEIGGDWSAHVFSEEQVAFVGFNSCYRNDRYWTGAFFNRLAVSNAQKHIESACPKNCLLLAVWHHGLRMEALRPDYLSYADVGQLYSAGFRLGFHGHTHRAEISQFDQIFKDRFVAVATGSLGAASKDRPDAVGNQFSIVEISSGVVETTVFDKSSSTGTWNAGPPRHVHVSRHTREEVVPSSCKKHTRLYSIDENGLCEAHVELLQSKLRGETTLGQRSL